MNFYTTNEYRRRQNEWRYKKEKEKRLKQKKINPTPAASSEPAPIPKTVTEKKYTNKDAARRAMPSADGHLEGNKPHIVVENNEYTTNEYRKEQWHSLVNKTTKKKTAIRSLANLKVLSIISNQKKRMNITIQAMAIQI